MITWKNPIITFGIGFTIGTVMFLMGSKSNNVVSARTNVINYVKEVLKDNRYNPGQSTLGFFDTGEQDMGYQQSQTMEPPVTADELTKTVKVLCFIVTAPKNHLTRAIHVKKTWGQRCNKLIFMSTEDDPELGAVKLNVSEGYNFLWAKSKRSLEYIYENYINEYDWFFKADDDTYVIMENLRNLLKDYNSDEGHFFGCNFKLGAKISYMSGGAGYVLSRKAVIKFVEEAIPDQKKCSTKDVGYEDVEMGKCLQSVGVEVDDSRDEFGKHRFLALPPVHYLVPGSLPKDFWWWKYIRYPLTPGKECCSNTGISFHYITPDNMYLFEFFLYQLRVVGITKTEGPLITTTTTEIVEIQSTSDSTLVTNDVGSDPDIADLVTGLDKVISNETSTTDDEVMTTTLTPKPKKQKKKAKPKSKKSKAHKKSKSQQKNQNHKNER